MAIIHSGDHTTRLRLVLQFSSSCIQEPSIIIIIYTLDQESTIYFVFEVKTSLGAPHALLSFELVFYFGITYLKGVF
jgi:hypothetical protein